MSEIADYRVPQTLAEAAELMRAGDATVLAGGTDLMPQSKSGKVQFGRTLINIRRIAELDGVTRSADRLRIGALTTVTGLMGDTLTRKHLPALLQACDHFASDQIRNAATLGGNICNASPAGDLLIPLLALDAEVVLVQKPNGVLTERRVPMDEFFVAPGRTKRTATELVAGVELKVPHEKSVGEFFKFGTRPALDISAISIAVMARRDGNLLRDVRIAIGAVAPTPIRAYKAEQALEGKVADEATVAQVLAAADSEIRPISDVRASDWYRRELVRNVLRRMLLNVA